jgi:Flp pilus assembly pilin Flp
MTKPVKYSERQPIGLVWLRRLLELLVTPFRGSAPGATNVEYVVVTGFVALFAIFAFNRFGSTLHRAYQAEARHVRGEGVPGASSILDDLGGLTDPDGLCDIDTGVCRPGSGMCFAAGTLVATETGQRPIERIEPGERVWATNVETGETALRQVRTTFIRKRAEVIDLDVRAGFASGERILVTPGHQFYIEKQGWTRADELDATPLWSSTAGVVATALVDETRFTTVYNLEVEDFHTYYVGEARVLVHNQTATPSQRNCQGNPAGPGTTTPFPNGRQNTGPLQCGEGGAYSNLPRRPGYQRDHVPSGGALKKRIEQLTWGHPLTSQQEQAMEKASPAFKKLMKAVENTGLTIAIPREVHEQHSRTFGGRNQWDQQVADSEDLAAAARADIARVQAGLAAMRPECLAAYNASAAQILNQTQADYEARLTAARDSLTPEEREEMQDAYESIVGGPP